MLREALQLTPALRTFDVINPSKAACTLSSSPAAIKAAFLLASSSGQTSHDHNAWFSDCRQIMAQCIAPMTFGVVDDHQSQAEVETLLLCYMDSFRRATPMAGLLEMTQSKLAAMSCDRLEAPVAELAIWHAAAFGREAPSWPKQADVPKDEDSSGVHTIVRGATADLLRITNRAPRSFASTSSTIFGSGTVSSLAHRSLESVLRCFLHVLETMRDAALNKNSTLQSLEDQLRHLQQISAEIVTSGAAHLLVGPHIIALSEL